MKPFIRIKKIHGYEYAYEVTPYHDKKTKKIKQKTRYPGKYMDGKIIRVNYKAPCRTLDYGECHRTSAECLREQVKAICVWNSPNAS